MATIVIIHGAFGGGWEWTDVARRLRLRGHEVFTPTLTGMGERFHLQSDVGLTVHINDILATFEYEDLHDVVLCGASYGGMAVTAAAERAIERVSRIVYIDALVPRDGQSGMDLLPETARNLIRQATTMRGDGFVNVLDGVLPPEGLISKHERNRFIKRLRPQPVRTFTEPVHLSGAVERIPRGFVRCTVRSLDVGGDPIEPMAQRAREEGWTYREMPAPHDPHLFDPVGTAAVLDELAGILHATTPTGDGCS